MGFRRETQDPARSATSIRGGAGRQFGRSAFHLIRDEAGQAMVMTGIMLAVFFGILGLVVDFGFVMIERRKQQNAADSAALGVARLLAGSVGIDSGGNVNYVDQTDTTVMTLAQSLAGGNWPGSGATRGLTIEYLDCNGNLIRAAVAGASTLIPQTTCRVRATGTSSRSTFFIHVLNPSLASTTASARATARIAPTSAPTGRGGAWPITRWKNYPGSVPCWFDFFTPCVFWSNNGGSEDTSIGSWKEKLYPSRYSRFDCSGAPTAQLLTAFDPARQGQHCGNSGAQMDDMEYWLRYGFNGTIGLNDRIEVHPGGVNGTNLATAMRDYISASPEGSYPGWGNYRTVTVALWQVAEVYQSGSWQSWTTSTSHPPDRVTISDLRCFRFYYNYVNSSSVSGHYVSCYQNTAPGSGAPSGTANTVQMVE
jgi:Flp pilus assembly protein TadG